MSETDELVEKVKVAMLTAAVEHGVRTDVQEHLVRGDGRGTVLPGALDRMARAAITAARAAVLEEAARAAWTAEPLPEYPVKRDDFAAFKYGRDCAYAAIRALRGE